MDSTRNVDWTLMDHRTKTIVIEDTYGSEVHTGYTRCLQSVDVKEGAVYVALNPRLERIWFQAKKRGAEADCPRFAQQICLPTFTVGRRNTLMKDQRLFSLEELRRVFGLESVKDADGNVVQEAPLPLGIIKRPVGFVLHHRRSRRR